MMGANLLTVAASVNVGHSFSAPLSEVRLDDIGFYTLSESRARDASVHSPLARCELIVSDACNFRCPYCRGLRADCRGSMSEEYALQVLSLWCRDGLQNVRFSGGEPTMWAPLEHCVRYARKNGVKRVAISTNGSADLYHYMRLLDAGVNDVSVSLDACCSAVGSVMAGREGVFGRVLDTIEALAMRTYVTLGVVLTGQNADQLPGILKIASDAGVADVRIIPAAQSGTLLPESALECIPDGRWPILHYRLRNREAGVPVRGLRCGDSDQCHLVLDDSVVAGGWHFPCVIYLREGGNPIGKVSPYMRSERAAWSMTHHVLSDPICRANCLDVCRQYNAAAHRYAKAAA